jgi:hypothetical protein
MERIPRIVWNFLVRPRSRYVLAWLFTLATAGVTELVAWNVFNSPKRPDGTLKRPGGNNGHTFIDFGGQWLMGRMLARGFGPHLYHRNYQRPILTVAYPAEEEMPDADRKPEDRGTHEAENLMTWFMGYDDPDAARAVAAFVVPLTAHDALGTLVLTSAMRVGGEDLAQTATQPQLGGPLYPPIHAFVMYPYGLLEPRPAYRCVQVTGLLLAFVAGWGVRVLSRGCIWWPVATAAVLLFPNFATTLNLGQNGVLALTVLIWGWTCIANGRPVLGGALWGLLAFKPVWAAAFFLVPLLTGRWRVCLAMLATGTSLALATLPFVGLQTWFDWLHVGRLASDLYKVDENWIFLSRDLLSVPRRWLIDFQKEHRERDNLAARVAGWALLLAVIECTVRLAILRKVQARTTTGPAAGFLLLGAWFSCFHFMYYDILLAALPVLVLLTEPRRFLQVRRVAFLSVPEDDKTGVPTAYHQPRQVSAYPSVALLLPAGCRNVWVLNSMILSLLALLAVTEFLFPALGLAASITAPGLKNGLFPLPLRYSMASMGTPWSTFCLLLLWLWCGWLWLHEGGKETGRPE